MLMPETDTMNQTRFTAEIARSEVEPRHHDLWRDAAALLGARTYEGTTVFADWTPMLSADPLVRMEVDVRGEADPREFPSHVERFFHDAFLALNLACPGAFGGMIVATGGEFRVNELALNPYLFVYASVDRLPLAAVMSWLDQRARGREAVLFHLLHIARSDDELATRVRLAACLEILGMPDEAQRVDARRAPVQHPLDDADDLEAADAIDRAAHLVIGALQRDVTGGGSC
jgi:hypothetical protein